MGKKGKTNKSLTKRFKITRNKKILHRPSGQDHFLAKRSSNKTRSKRVERNFNFFAKTLKQSI